MVAEAEEDRTTHQQQERPRIVAGVEVEAEVRQPLLPSPQPALQRAETVQCQKAPEVAEEAAPVQ